MKQALKPPPGMQPRIAALICVVLEDVTTKDLRIGFVAGSLDGRGVWTRSPEEGGHQERALAAQYRARAASVEIGFPYVARTLRDTARHYDAHAEAMDTRAELERRAVE